MSLLRYPGGKTRAINILNKIFMNEFGDGVECCYSPFFGGGSFELFLKNTYGMSIIANDKFEPLINFWLCAKNDPHLLTDEINKLKPLSRDKFYEIRRNSVIPRLYVLLNILQLTDHRSVVQHIVVGFHKKRLRNDLRQIAYRKSMKSISMMSNL